MLFLMNADRVTINPALERGIQTYVTTLWFYTPQQEYQNTYKYVLNINSFGAEGIHRFIK